MSGTRKDGDEGARGTEQEENSEREVFVVGLRRKRQRRTDYKALGTREEVLRLRDSGMSIREISRVLSIPKSTAGDFVRARELQRINGGSEGSRGTRTSGGAGGAKGTTDIESTGSTGSGGGGRAGGEVGRPTRRRENRQQRWSGGKESEASELEKHREISQMDEDVRDFYAWMHQRRLPVSGAMLRDMALFVAEKRGNALVQQLSNRLKDWAWQYDIRELQGHARLVDGLVDATQAEESKMRGFWGMLSEFPYDDIFYFGQAELLYRCLPSRNNLTSPLRRNTAAHAEKESRVKERVTFIYCVNASGTVKVPIAVVGAHPNGFTELGKTGLRGHYLYQRHAWINSDVLFNWLLSIFCPYLKEQRGSRRTALVFDEWAASCVLPPLENVAFFFLPRDIGMKDWSTELKQIARIVRWGYRSRLLDKTLWALRHLQAKGTCNKRVVANGGRGLDYGCAANIEDAVELLGETWDKIDPSLIANCFVRSRWLPEEHRNNLQRAQGAVGRQRDGFQGEYLLDVHRLSREMAGLQEGKELERDKELREIVDFLELLRASIPKPHETTIARCIENWMFGSENRLEVANADEGVSMYKREYERWMKEEESGDFQSEDQENETGRKTRTEPVEELRDVRARLVSLQKKVPHAVLGYEVFVAFRDLIRRLDKRIHEQERSRDPHLARSN